MTWRLLVGGSRGGRAVDVDNADIGAGLCVTRPTGFDALVADPDIEPTTTELYQPQKWYQRMPHPCVPGLDVYREWLVLVKTPWQQFHAQPQMIQAELNAAAEDVRPDLVVLEPTGMHEPFSAAWWDTPAAWTERLQKLLER